MTMPVLAESELPRTVTALLETFRAAHAPAALELWQLRDDQWLRLFPDSEDIAGEVAERRDIVAQDGAKFRLDLGAELLDQADFLAAAVSRVLEYEVEARSAAHELTERYEEINLLYSISEILGAILSVDDASNRIVTEVADVMGARRASLWVLDPEAQLLRLAAGVGEGLVQGPIPVDDPNSVTARVFREKQPLSLERDEVVPRETRLEPRPLGREAFLSVPMSYTPPEGDARTVGVITLVGKATARFTAGDMRLLTAIASQVAAAIEMQRLVQESLRQERLVRELELAHDLQLKLLPQAADFGDSAEVAARCVPADSVGGDFYHLFHLPGGRFGVMIGDVSGHGFSAALIMALTMSAVAISAQDAASPGELMRRVHRAIVGELESTEMYIGLIYVMIDPEAGVLSYANAGHPHAFVIRAKGGVERLSATEPPLGMMPLDHYTDKSIAWASREDLLCLFTDGLSDTYTSGGTTETEGRLISDIARVRGQPVADILDMIFARPERTRPDLPADDRTALLVRI